MKVLLVNTSERTGGAAVACKRLLDALNKNGVGAKMLVRDKQTDDPNVVALPTARWKLKFHFVWERFLIWLANGFSRKNLFAVDIACSGSDITGLPEFREADVIHLHWVNQGMLSLKGIRRILESGKPVVWTMHDMWECTAICHHSLACERFKTACGNCPQLRFPGEKDLAHRVFGKKKEIFNRRPFHVTVVSRWLAEQVGQSALLSSFPLALIPNTISPSDFRPTDKIEARRALKLPASKHIILFGAARIDDPIKGVQHLLAALQCLIEQGKFRKEDLLLLLFGNVKDAENLFPRIPVAYVHYGLVNSTERLSLLYSAADVMVSASLYETFGQTLIESQACACLPVSFGNSGQRDIIEHKRNGYLAAYLSAESLAEGIEWVIKEGIKAVSPEALREDVLRRFSPEVVAKQYVEVYESALRSR